MRTVRMAILAMVVTCLAASCGSDPAPAQPSGRMVVQYEEAESPDALRGKQLMQSRKLLEDFAEDVNSDLALPGDIPLIGDQCDEPNAFWSSEDNVMVICYEWAAKMQDLLADTPKPDDSAIGAVTATFYHELGHAVIHLFDLPFTGREEDVADQLAAVLLLLPDPSGNAGVDDRQAAMDFADMFDRLSARNELSDRHFSDVHSLSRQRMYNFLCWIYGSDPKAGANLVTSGRVPEDRAESCVTEFDQMHRGWSKLLKPHLKGDA